MRHSRSEYKFLLAPGHIPELLRWVKRFSSEDSHSLGAGPEGYQVTSVYFDSDEFHCANDKINGVAARRKFRMRHYGGDSNVFLETKDTVVETRYKWRRATDLKTLDLDYKYLLAGTLKREDSEAEFMAQLRQHRLQPKMWVDYRRRAFQAWGETVRITIDSKIRATPFKKSWSEDRNHCVDFSRHIFRGKNVVEIKLEAYPYWIETLVRQLSQFRFPLSKYVLATNVFWGNF